MERRGSASGPEILGGFVLGADQLSRRVKKRASPDSLLARPAFEPIKYGQETLLRGLFLALVNYAQTPPTRDGHGHSRFS